VAQSPGTFGLPYISTARVPGVWLTPIVTNPLIVDALRAVSPMQLVIGGSADPSWQPELVAGTAAELVTIAAADHSLELEDADWRASMLTQVEIIDWVAAHAERARSLLTESAFRILKEQPCSLIEKSSAMPATSAGSPSRMGGGAELGPTRGRITR
jgi:hypothetical protein